MQAASSTITPPETTNHTDDIESMINSSKAAGEYFIVTCACGIPQCAGIYKAVRVTYTKDNVRLSCSEPVEFDVVINKNNTNKVL